MTIRLFLALRNDLFYVGFSNCLLYRQNVLKRESSSLAFLFWVDFLRWSNGLKSSATFIENKLLVTNKSLSIHISRSLQASLHIF